MAMTMINSAVGTGIRDIRAGLKFGQSLLQWKMVEMNNYSLDRMFAKTVAKNPNKTALVFENKSWTFKQLDEFSNRIANTFLSFGFKAGDEVALLMKNSHEYVGIWLGLIKVGIIPAFINTNNRMDALNDCFNALKCKAIIFDSEFTEAFEDIYHKLLDNYPSMEFFVWTQERAQNSNEDNNNVLKESKIPIKSFRHLLENFSDTGLDSDHKRNYGDTLLHIFTSGTTGGKAKATIQTDGRFIVTSLGQKYMFGLKKSDIIYSPFPMYHILGGVSSVSMCLIFGLTLVIAEKFSATEFWKECIKNKCTVSVYIGEICRYLLAQPPKPEDTQHTIRDMYGIGLRKEYWQQFKDRFAIKNIYEVYSASEANVILVNIDNKEGSCGFYPWYYGMILRLLFPAVIIKVDPDTLEPERNKKGLCKVIRPGQTGILVGRSNYKDSTRNFRGYTDPQETEKKLLHNVLTKGDKAFFSGDLIEMDFFGYLYFKDRCGDTFRWKGENVSTTDVEAVLQNYLNLNDSLVFGVTVPHCEGRAGMAVINAQTNEIDWKEWTQQLIKRLPFYAVPLFIRLTSSIEVTSSFKIIKYKLKRDGFDPKTTNDLIYFFDKTSNSYIRLTNELFENIENGLIKL